MLTTQENLLSVLEYINSRNAQEDFAIVSQAEARAFSKESPPTVENGIGLLTIEGSLTYKWNWLSAMCGLASYQQITADFENMIEQGAHTVVLDIDSPGGMAHGNFEAAMAMRDMADANGVRIVTYVDGICASAALALASVSDEIIMNPLSKIGSIGVVVSLYNELPMKIKEGAEAIFVYSGDSKVPYDAEGKIRQDFIDEIQKDTDALYTQFIRHVAQFRPMSEGEIRDTQAKMFRAEDATVKGLADRVMTSAEFIEYLAQLSEKQQEKESMPIFGFGKKKQPNMSQEEPEVSLEEPSPSSELLEGNNQEGVQDNPESPSMQSKEETNEEVNMTLEELLASNPEAKEQFDTLTSAKAEELSGELKKQLEKLESERVEAAKAEYKELVAGYSFVGADAQEKVATFLYNANAEKMEGVEEVMEALESARNAVEAVVDEEIGDSGEQLEVDEQARDQSLVREQIKKRYAK
tara:strand:- start:55253 stop:56656 length:1404 start_codon:yes stop_codon:yes gene_type:complete